MFGYSNQTYPGAIGTPSPFINYIGTRLYEPSPQGTSMNQPLGNNTGSFMAVFVNGEEEVEKYPVAAGLTVMLIDFTLKKFWLKSTGMNGVPQPLRVFPFTEEATKTVDVNQNGITREEFDALSAKLDKLISELGGAK